VTVEILTQTSRTSPLATYAEQLASVPKGVSIREVPFLTQLDLRVAPGTEAAAAASRILGVALPTAPSTSVTGADGVLVLWLGPDEWLVLAPAGRDDLEHGLADALGAEGAVVDVSAQRTTLAIAGTRARDLLAHGCAIDLDPRVTPQGTCVQTLLALAGVVLVARDATGTDFWVLVRSSFARYLADWLIDACQEYRDDPTWQ
jgi:sarcosine oxidase subunit gamma